MRVLIETFIVIISVVFIGSIIIMCTQCSSYLTSGEVGKDIGEFAGEVSKGYQEAKE